MNFDPIATANCLDVASWYDLQKSGPLNPIDLIESAVIVGGGNDVGVFLNSTTYSPAGTVWSPGAIPISQAPTCSALQTDNFLAVQDADQWNFNHLTWSSDPALPPPLQTLLYLRGGRQWQMNIPLNLGALVYTDFQLSFLDNAAMRGDCNGTTPVISWQAHTHTPLCQ